VAVKHSMKFVSTLSNQTDWLYIAVFPYTSISTLPDILPLHAYLYLRNHTAFAYLFVLVDGSFLECCTLKKNNVIQRFAVHSLILGRSL